MFHICVTVFEIIQLFLPVIGRNVDCTSTAVLHLHFRMGAFHWLPQSAAGRMRGSVPQESVVQHSSDHRLLLDHLNRSLHPLRRNL